MPNNAVLRYAEVDFESRPSPERTPDRLGVHARLRGIPAADPGEAAVLELGCGSARSLIAQAALAPNAHFTGIDGSVQLISKARQLAETLELTNISFLTADLSEDPNLEGKYDYILCHGVYSWVPEPIRGQIFSIVADRLTPYGVALVSHNSLPGWTPRYLLQRALRSTLPPEADSPDDQLAFTEAYLDVLDAALEEDSSPYGQIIKGEVKAISKQSRGFLFHEMLNPESTGELINTVIERAQRCGLKYLSDAAPHRERKLHSTQKNWELESRDFFNKELSLAGQELILELVNPLSFRSSLFVSNDLKPCIIEPESLLELHAAAPLVASEVPNALDDRSPGRYTDPRGYEIEARDPALKALLQILSFSWPGTIPVRELVDSALQLAKIVPVKHDAFRAVLLRELKSYFTKSLVNLHLVPNLCSTEIPDLPRVTPLTQWEVRESSWVSTLSSEFLTVDAFDRALVPLLDGSRTITELVADLTPRSEDNPGAVWPPSQEEIEKGVMEALQRYRAGGLLLKS